MSLPQYLTDLALMSISTDYQPVDIENPSVVAAMANRATSSAAVGGITIKRGEELFEGTDYPREWAGFVGQTETKEQLQVAIASATARGKRLDHTLLASGTHGIGKSTLATLIAYKAGAGLVQAQGPISLDKAAKILRSMQDGDVLFIDEVHSMAGGEWLLPFMTEGRLYTANGVIECPDVTIIGATTDVGKLPSTMISRFMIKPTLVPYNDTESAQLAESLAIRMNVVLDKGMGARIARAASSNPRDMRSILVQVRDLQFAFPNADVDATKAFKWAGFAPDGLTVLAQEMLIVLSQQPNFTASIETLGSILGEPGPLKHHEQMLLQRGFTTITGRGRQMTPAGMARVLDIANGV